MKQRGPSQDERGSYRDMRSVTNQPSTDRGTGPQLRPDDALLQEHLHVRLSRDADIDARDLSVVVTDGVATLSGTVSQRAMKDHAEQVAAAFEGVREVDNRMRVGEGAESFGPAGQAVRSGAGADQQGSGFSSSERTEFSERAIGSTPAEGTPDVPRRDRH